MTPSDNLGPKMGE